MDIMPTASTKADDDSDDEDAVSSPSPSSAISYVQDFVWPFVSQR
jgi:hypothetical protein